MILREFIKRTLNLGEPDLDIRAEVKDLKEKVSDLKDQVEIKQVEILHLKEKLVRVRELIGRDDECFSIFRTKQIEKMSIGDFNEVESEIDKDMADGKIFLR